MSDTIDRSDESGDPEILAGEYVLGLLEPEAARRSVAAAGADTPLGRAVARWEHDFAPLLGLVAPVNPPPSLWTRLERSAFGTGADTGVPPASPGRLLRAWRGAAVAFAVAAAVAGVALIRTGPAPAPVPVAALIPKEAGRPVIVADRYRDGRVLLRPVGTVTVAAGRDLELWSLPDGATRPVALGVLPSDGVVLPPGRFPDRPGQILVSLEPTGGSPTGLPTGPVLWGGRLR